MKSSLGCLLLVALVVFGGPLILLAHTLTTGSTASRTALLITMLLSIVFAALLWHYKRTFERRLQTGKPKPAPPNHPT
jgi:hypothetical protein